MALQIVGDIDVVSVPNHYSNKCEVDKWVLLMVLWSHFNPFEFTERLEWFCLKDCQFLWLRKHLHEIYSFVDILSVLSDIKPKLREQVNWVLNFEDFRAVKLFATLCVSVDVVELWLGENSFVVFTKLKNWMRVRSSELFVVGMGWRPLIIVKVKPENFTFEELGDCKTFLNDDMKVSFE